VRHPRLEPDVGSQTKRIGVALEIGQHLSMGWKHRVARRHREVIEGGEVSRITGSVACATSGCKSFGTAYPSKLSVSLDFHGTEFASQNAEPKCRVLNQSASFQYKACESRYAEWCFDSSICRSHFASDSYVFSSISTLGSQSDDAQVSLSEHRFH
jgi:hypothetical protein